MPNDNNQIPTGLYWQGKRTEVERISLPFQTIETINESRATREKEKDTLLRGLKKKEDPFWHNRLIWGDNKYVMSSLLYEFAGKIDLICIDPPFATGADFSVKIEVGDVEWTKEPSAIEEKAYRDIWGKGLDSYLQMMYDRLVLIRDLLSETASIYVNLDWRVAHYVKLLLDEDQFAKLAETYTRFSIEYLSARGAIRYYYPDFVAEQKLPNGNTCMWIIETKGWEDKDVPHKDERTVEWCKSVIDLTGQQWRYIKVPYSIFNSSKYKTFRELVETIKAMEEKALL